MDLGFTIIDKFFKENPNFLVDHHLESYNRFVNNDIRQIIRQNNPISFNKKLQSKNGEDIPMHQCDIYIGGKQGDKIQFAKPILYENGEKNYLYPNYARLQNLTYSFSIMVDIDCEFKINENADAKIHTIKDVFFGNIPIMVQSDMCILNKMPSDVRFNMGECKIDPGGYFIIDGNEKTVISQERFANNILRVSKTNDENNMFIAEIRSESEDESKPVRETKVHLVTYKDEENLFNEHKDDMKHIPQLVFQQIVVTIPNINIPIPLFIVFRALGIISDQDIIKMCVPDDDPRMMELLRPSVYDANKIFTQQLAIEYMAPFTKYLTNYHTWFILSDYFLPHINDLSEIKRHFTFDLVEKAHFLGFMVNKLLRVAIDLDKPTDRDSFQFKRVEPSGVLLSDLFKEFYKSQIKHVIKMMDIYHNETESTYDDDSDAFKQFCVDTISPVLKQRITEKGMIAGFKGDWGSETYTKRIGLSQELNRLSYNTAISLLRKCVMQMDDNSVVLGPRYLHATQWGMMDPVDSDGGDVGTHKSFSICTKISTETSKLPILQMLHAYTKKAGRIYCIEIVYTKPEILFAFTKIFVNGHWKYSTNTPNELMIDLKQKRRTGDPHITIWTSISFNIRENIIYIYTDAGRVYRPLLYIDNTKNVSFDIEDAKVTWSSMLHGKPGKPSSIEYIDCTESNNSLISLNHLPSYHDTNFTHVEIHPSLILGFMGLHIIFPEHNPLPRNAFSCGQSRQAVSVYNTNYQNRMDKMGVVLNYGQVPLIKSYYLHHLNQEYIPYGINAMVAIMCYTGYNTEDAILINRSSLQRGMFNTSYFTVYEETEDEETGLLFASNEEVPEYDEFGVIREQINVDGKTPIMNMSIRGKTRPVYTKRDQRGYIDKTFITTNPVGSRTAKVRICEERIPNIGDKFASRAGQKGTCGIILDECNMPFNENGIRPDLIINPHAIPSRMTLGQLLECLIGKVHLEHGTFGDCTVFNKKTDLHTYADKLREYDFHSSGVEVLYNGMSGEPVQSDIFIGPTYYMRLKHMVKDKINFRERGPMTGLTRQPVQGRAKEGGLRIGEMERDGVLANGMNMFETESMMIRGDGTYIDTVTHSRKPYRLTIDNVTGFISIVNNTNTHYSPSIDGPLTIDENGIQSIPKYNKSYSTINVPYSFKLFMQEIATMNIQMRLVTTDNIQQLAYMGWTPIKTSFESVISEQGFTLVGKLIHDFQENSLYVSSAKLDPCSKFDYMLHRNANRIINRQTISYSKPILDYTLFPCIFNKKLRQELLLTSTQINPKKYITTYCKSKFNLNIYDSNRLSEESYPIQTTVNYIFDHLKTGIFVRIKNNKVVNFMLMYNTEYINSFAELLYVKKDGQYVSVLENKDALEQFLNAMPRKKKHKNPIYWHATNCLIRTELNDMNPTDAYLSEMYDLFVNVCNRRVVHDCVFILNRKDFPHLQKEWKEPFVDIYGDTPLSSDYFEKQFIPILSQCTHDKYADIPIPTGDDLDLLYQNKMFATYSNTHTDKHDRVRCKNDSEKIDIASLPPWKDRELKFVWRGQSTGCGVDEDTNPRIKLEQLCNNEAFSHKEYMNVKITRITERIKTTRVKTNVKNKTGDVSKSEIAALTFVPSRFIEDDAKVPMAKQVLCKFMFNVQGNSAAYRFGNLFKYGCCIINIESPFKLWFEPFLNTEYITSKNKDTVNAKHFHCVTVKSDFSNFEETIEWCLQHQDICEQIARNGQDFFNKYFNESFIFDYVADIFNGISNRLAQPNVRLIHESTHLPELETLRNEYTIKHNFPLFKENVVHTEECELNTTLVIVPYRDEGDQNRKQQLDQFVEHYSQHPSLRILVVEQSNDGQKFNRGALLNAGYLYATEHFTDIETVIFHDVDIIMPADIVNKYYGNCDKYKILHLGNLVQDTKYNPPFGRVIQFSKETFEKINGFPNYFYGWGGEDDALAFRIHVSNATDYVYRPDKSEGKPAKELETINDIKKTTDVDYKQSKIELYKWENICLDRHLWKINGLNSLQFKTMYHKELKPTVHHIITELIPSPPDKDLLHAIFKHPTDKDIEVYQLAYKHFYFSNPVWDTVSDSSKIENLKQFIELLQKTSGDDELGQNTLLHLLFINPTPQQEKDFAAVYENVKIIPEWSRKELYKELLEMGHSPADLIAPPYELGTTPIYTENASPPYKVTPEPDITPRKDIDGGTVTDENEQENVENPLLTYDPTTGGDEVKEEDDKKTINYTEK